MMSSLNAEYTLSLSVAGAVLMRWGWDKEERVRDRIRYPLPRVAAFGTNSSTQIHLIVPETRCYVKRIQFAQRAGATFIMQRIIYSWYVHGILAGSSRSWMPAWCERWR